MRVLVAEDEARLSGRLAAALHDAGYAVDCTADGERADFLGQTERYDAVVLDLGLPRLDGLTLLRRWRDAGIGTPVLVLTARGSWHEKVLGIDSGADDYMAKPFQMEEVLARLRALIRRAAGQPTPQLRSGAVSLDPRLLRVTLDGAPSGISRSYIAEQSCSVLSRMAAPARDWCCPRQGPDRRCYLISSSSTSKTSGPFGAPGMSRLS